jgi:hypothetical protein
LQKKALSGIKPINFKGIHGFWNKMWKIIGKITEKLEFY